MRLSPILTSVLLLSRLTLVSEFLVVAQSQGLIKPTGCEYNNAVLDTLAQQTKRDHVIVVVARLGTSEKRKGLNPRRLHNVLVYLTEFTTEEGGRRKPDDIVLAEGSSHTPYGVIELYAEGKLFGVLRPGENADLYVGTCVPDDPKQDICNSKNDSNFYPCLKSRGGRQ